jgi:hypothetical protein
MRQSWGKTEIILELPYFDIILKQYCKDIQ